MKEEWKPIKGYEGFYEISNLGRVKCIQQIREVGHSPNRVRKLFKVDRLLNPWDNGRGYRVVSFGASGVRKNYYVHRLVAEHFIPNPNGLEEVNHKDFNKSNNHVDNLEWCDRRYNAYYSIDNYKRPKNTQLGSLGEKYITERVVKGRVSYRVKMYGRSEKTFYSLDEAIMYRDRVLKDEKDYSKYEGMFRLSNDTEPT